MFSRISTLHRRRETPLSVSIYFNLSHMPKAPKAAKTPKVKIPDIPWAEDDYKLISAFLTELEKPENYKVLFGKKNSAEVSNTL